MSIDNIKVFTKLNQKKELVTLIKTIRIYSQDTGMEFGIEKYIMLRIKSVKIESAK